MTLTRNILNEHLHSTFVETGTYKGDAVDLVLSYPHVKHIHTIELSKKYYCDLQEKYNNEAKVNLHKGDSEHLLKYVMKEVSERTTVWLDAHYSMPDSASGQSICPVLEELEQLRHHNIKTHTILIDDMRLMPSYGITVDDIIVAIMKINSNYTIEYMDCDFPDDVLVAHIATNDLYKIDIEDDFSGHLMKPRITSERAGTEPKKRKVEELNEASASEESEMAEYCF